MDGIVIILLMILVIIIVLLIFTVLAVQFNDKLHENDIYINVLQKHIKMQQNQINNLTLQNDNLMTVISLLEQKNGGK